MFEMICNEDCMKTMEKLQPQSIDLILTSPPYNTGRASNKESCLEHHYSRYDVHLDGKTQDEFLEWRTRLFTEFDRILKPNGVILWNMSYGNDFDTNNGIGLLWVLIGHLVTHTNFNVGDCVFWRKTNGSLPNNVSPNKLTRLCEDVFVFCRKDEIKTYFANKEVSKVGKNGLTYYKPLYNYIESRCNDGSCPLNKATFSSDFAVKLLEMYAPINGDTIVYDPFMGTGTTAVACKKLGIGYLGSEISPAQCDWAENRLKEVTHEVSDDR